MARRSQLLDLVLARGQSMAPGLLTPRRLQKSLLQLTKVGKYMKTYPLLWQHNGYLFALNLLLFFAFCQSWPK